MQFMSWMYLKTSMCTLELFLINYLIFYFLKFLLIQTTISFNFIIFYIHTLLQKENISSRGMHVQSYSYKYILFVILQKEKESSRLLASTYLLKSAEYLTMNLRI